MRRPRPSRSARRSRTTATFALWLVSLAAPLLAQHNGGGPPGGGQQSGIPGGGMNGGINVGPGSGQSPMDRQSPPPGSWPEDGATRSTMRHGLQLGPPGRWWNDDRFARSLGLDRDQQHRMDEIFRASKDQLVSLYRGLRHEESQLDRLSRAPVLDEAQIDAQIDKVVQARGDLEKANAHMLLEIRKQMTPDQTARLDEHRPPPPPDDH